MTDTARIRTIFLDGPAGKLEALVDEGSDQPRFAALVAHPHPLFGGTMHNKVVFHAMKALNNVGCPVLRFNFRGVGLSEGTHAQGIGEMQDVKSGLDWLEQEFHLPLIFAGFSFGAATGLRVSCPDDRVKAVIALGLPVKNRDYTYEYLNKCAKPKLFVSGGHDEFGPPEAIRAVVDRASEPKELVIIEGVDHFFAGKLSEMRLAVQNWTERFVADQLK